MVERSHPLNQTDRWIGNVYLELQPVKGLTFRSEVSMDLASTRDRLFKDAYFYSEYDKADKNYISRSMNRAQTMRYENTLTYRNDWGKHSFSAMVGQTTEEYKYYFIGGAGASILNPSPNNWYLNQATDDRTESSDSAARTRMFSLLGRLHYSYDNRATWLPSTSVRTPRRSSPRTCGATYFPSTALAWRISEEPWLRGSDVLDNLKLRAGWGQIGNDKINTNSFTQVMFNSGPSFVDYPLGLSPVLIRAPPC